MKNQPQSRGNQRDKRGPRPQDRWNNKPRFRPEEGDENMLEGRNAVTEALRSGREIDKIYFASGAVGTLGHLIAQARQKGITAQEIDRRKLDAMSITGSHQGIIALCAAVPYRSLEDMLALARERGEKPLLVLCDGITDPHNLGAVIRSAETAGAHGVIIPKRRSCGLTAVAAKTSAGAVEHLPVARVTNLAAAVDELKAAGVWIYCAEAGGQKSLYEADFKDAAAIVIGSEGAGVSRLIREKCDFTIRIPMKGRVSSLNASAAAAVLLYEAVRQRQ